MKQLNVGDVSSLSNVRLADIEVKGLALSICQVGVLHPIRVEDHTKSAGPDAGTPSYVLVAGHRWLAAAIAAGLETVPAVVVPPSDHGHRMLEQTAENL